MTAPAEQQRVVVRPRPSEREIKYIDAGKSRANPGASSSWYEKGALEGQGGAMWLVDADGVRHALPLPPLDGALYRIEIPWQQGGSIGVYVEIFVTDGNFRRTVDLPTSGFLGDGLSQVAYAAGLKYGAFRTEDKFTRTDQTLDLRKASLAEADRHHLPHLFGKH